MLLPNRHESSNEYRYGFNGMEKDDEVSGEGNSYDFGARLYNPRVGRWLTLDPMASSYPNQSPYNFAVNSPLLFNDPNGEDAIVTIDKSHPNQTTITFSTKVYVTGTGYEKDGNFIKDLQSISNEVFSDWTHTENGHTYIVKYDVKYVDAMGDKKRKQNLRTPKLPAAVINAKTDGTRDVMYPIPNSQSGIREGENYAIITDNPSKSGESRAFKGRSMAEIDQDYTVKGAADKRSITIFTTIHEIGHLLGYGDRYTVDAKGNVIPDKGYENDIMARSDDNLNVKGGTNFVHNAKRDKSIIDNVISNSNNDPHASSKKQSKSLFKMLKWSRTKKNKNLDK